jgi:predicted alpha/beta superfamily hydrolase
MRITPFALILLLLTAGCVTPKPPLALYPPRPHVTGYVDRMPAIASKFISARNVDVWLPPSYFKPEASDRCYPVIYMHDGQNAFDPATSTDGLEWGLDETMTRLLAGQKVREAIVVAIWNTPRRLVEYMPSVPPSPPLPHDPYPRYQVARRHPLGDAYLRYLVTELKPAVDARYRTLPGREDTFIMGSSMGGLISFYAICTYPDVFGGAACLSTAWPAAGEGFIASFKGRLPSPRTHKIYFDFGSKSLDAAYGPYQRRMDALMRQSGYIAGENWLTDKYPGDGHNERAWGRRVHVPLEFLLGSAPAQVTARR